MRRESSTSRATKTLGERSCRRWRSIQCLADRSRKTQSQPTDGSSQECSSCTLARQLLRFCSRNCSTRPKRSEEGRPSKTTKRDWDSESLQCTHQRRLPSFCLKIRYRKRVLTNGMFSCRGRKIAAGPIAFTCENQVLHRRQTRT